MKITQWLKCDWSLRYGKEKPGRIKARVDGIDIIFSAGADRRGYDIQVTLTREDVIRLMQAMLEAQENAAQQVAA
jgi:hypothetical protein